MTAAGKSSILWRCRRGTKEMDLLLQRFVHDCFDRLSAGEQECFARLLDQPDPDLMDWILGRSEPPTPEFRRLIAGIRGTSSADH